MKLHKVTTNMGIKSNKKYSYNICVLLGINSEVKLLEFLEETGLFDDI